MTTDKREYNRQYWLKNKHRLSPINMERARKHYARNAEKEREKRKIYRKEKREEIALRAANWRKEHPREAFANDIRAKYGMSLAYFDKLLIDQNGRCKICDVPVRWICVDHCHKTGIVRGLLCNPCNSFVGKIENSPTMLAKLGEYLQD